MSDRPARMSFSPPAVAPRANSMFASYRGTEHLYDECMDERGAMRSPWSALGSLLDKLGTDELQSRFENARRIIREHGITYNVYSDPQGIERPWELDLIPLLITPDEWRIIKRGLIQRATLFNLILEDLYGPQELIRTGALPPALVFANPAFVRPVHGVRVAKNIYLHLHGTDLARASSGEWWVLADRTQSPSGTGYALENRIVSAHVLPDEYKGTQVQRLAPFFAAQREMLRSLAPEGSDNPHIVLLTPGPLNETYFEHAYLARYLGFTLVEGGDLTVREQCVYLKTLEGLQKVDVILRRVDDTFCDPLELRGDSFLGIAGLVQAARAKKVTIANALGCTLMESPAFLPFLPGLCRILLGEELLIPSVATWWCGQAGEQRYVLDNLDKMVVKPAFGAVSQLPFIGRELTKPALEKLAGEISRRPFAYVGQEQVAFSTAPTWVGGKLEPRGVAVRLYAAATSDGYSIMPGGLSRISSNAGAPVLTMQSGGGSKDLWVLSDEPVAPVTLLTATGQPATHGRISTELPSRVADSLFWLGRYSERLESMLRLLRCVLGRISDESSAEAPAELSALAEMLVLTERLPKKFKGRVPARELESELLLMVYSSNRVGSVREMVLRLRHIASTVRDRLSIDTWRILTQLQL
ncbi:MAG TPA: circularly permuted type 2 ATP-grasp protein, partial [Candidatus Kapabacteria bacterium]|nr:circularly permuted type 2 ATP-grasp protein [Candidatus Kapabacteria bacterium]